MPARNVERGLGVPSRPTAAREAEVGTAVMPAEVHAAGTHRMASAAMPAEV
jgi:hypothetical protein